MIQFVQQKRATLVFILIVSIMVLLMSHDVANRGGTNVAGEIIFKAGTPAVRAGSSVTTFFGDLFRNYVDLRDARAESQRLREELLRTERERDRLQSLASNAERLQALLDLRRSSTVPGVAARVVGSGFASGRSDQEPSTLLLDRGADSGVQTGMPVIALGGVVGKTVLVSPELAKVMCITDRASGVAVEMEGSGYQGILVGRDRGSCELQYLPAYVEVSRGDLLVTSGLDRIYPRGIPVGRVVGVEGTGVSRRFEVIPLVDFQRLSEVLVLRAPPPPRAPEDRPAAEPPQPPSPPGPAPGREQQEPGAKRPPRVQNTRLTEGPR